MTPSSFRGEGKVPLTEVRTFELTLELKTAPGERNKEGKKKTRYPGKFKVMTSAEKCKKNILKYLIF